MSERKVITKYYPPDFDFRLIPKQVKKRTASGSFQLKVRMMLPMSVRCTSCGEYIYQGKKFNSRKETVTGEGYLGLRIFRFYFRCTRCSAELTIKTDPENSDYVAEHNCVRNFEAWRDPKVVAEAKERERQLEKKEKGLKDAADVDAMKQLESRTLSSKVEMDAIDDLEEIKTMNDRNAVFSVEDLLEIHREDFKEIEGGDKQIKEEDIDQEYEKLFNSSNTIKRLEPSLSSSTVNASLGVPEKSFEDHQDDEILHRKTSTSNSSREQQPKRQRKMDLLTAAITLDDDNDYNSNYNFVSMTNPANNDVLIAEEPHPKKKKKPLVSYALDDDDSSDDEKK